MSQDPQATKPSGIPTVPPKGVPESARHVVAKEETPLGWEEGTIELGSGRPVGCWRWWDSTGVLVRSKHFSQQGGQIVSYTPGDPNPFDEAVNAFLDGKENRLAYLWSPALHDLLVPRLPNYPMSRTTAYLRMLYLGVRDPDSSRYACNISKPLETIVLVESCLLQYRSSDEIGELFCIHAYGLYAALARFDVERVSAWFQALQELKLPPKSAQTTAVSRLVASAKRKKGSLYKQVTPFLDGTITASIESAHSLCEQGLSSQLQDDQLYQMAVLQDETAGIHYTTSEGRDWIHNLNVILRDPRSGEAWITTSEGSGLYFDGAKFTSKWTTEAFPHNYYPYTGGCTQSDERVLLWSGKHNWTLLQRYGRAVLWHRGEYFPGRGQAEPIGRSWTTAPSETEAQRFIAVILSQQPTNARETTWFRGKKAIVRTYHHGSPQSVGVWKQFWVSQSDVLQTFVSHDAAVAAFNSQELERFQNGDVIQRLDLAGPFDGIGSLG